MSITTEPFSADTIERVLCLCPRVHIYQIPPLTSNKGHTAANWTADPARQIFTARLRVLESATPISSSISSASSAPGSNTTNNNNNNADGGAARGERQETPEGDQEIITTTILLEDPTTGALFAAAPYTSPAVVEPAQDSSRFFAVRVVAPQEDGKKPQTAILGMGFEDRADAVDFGICLQEARKVLGFDRRPQDGGGGKKIGVGGAAGTRKDETIEQEKEKEKRDWSLKEGETIKIDIAGKGRRRMMHDTTSPTSSSPSSSTGNNNTNDAKTAFFSIKPPPPPPLASSSSSSSLSSTSTSGPMIPTLLPPPPPPSSHSSSADRRRSREVAPSPASIPPTAPAAGPVSLATSTTKSESAEITGFDDGEFGEFQ